MWTIKDVSRMTGVSRDDIHSVCERRKTASFIFCPEDSRPGRRFFSVEDIKKIWLVGRYKDMGYKLPDIAKIFKKAQEEDLSFSDQLSSQIEELENRRRVIDQQIDLAKRMRDYSNLASEPDSAYMLLVMRDMFARMPEVVANLFPDEEDPIRPEDFDEKANESLGMSYAEFIDHQILGMGDLNELEARDLELEGIAQEHSEEDGEVAPDGEVAFRVVDSIIAGVAEGCSIEDEGLKSKFAWIILDELFGTPESELLMAMTCGEGAYEFIQEAMKSYARKKWSAGADEGGSAEK